MAVMTRAGNPEPHRGRELSLEFLHPAVPTLRRSKDKVVTCVEEGDVVSSVLECAT